MPLTSLNFFAKFESILGRHRYCQHYQPPSLTSARSGRCGLNLTTKAKRSLALISNTYLINSPFGPSQLLKQFNVQLSRSLFCSFGIKTVFTDTYEANRACYIYFNTYPKHRERNKRKARSKNDRQSQFKASPKRCGKNIKNNL